MDMILRMFGGQEIPYLRQIRLFNDLADRRSLIRSKQGGYEIFLNK